MRASGHRPLVYMQWRRGRWGTVTRTRAQGDDDHPGIQSALYTMRLHHPCSVSLPAESFHAPFPLYYRCTRVDQDLGHQTQALTGTQAKVRPRLCIPEPIISPLSGSRSCDTSSVSADDITGIPLSLPRHLMKYVTRHGGPRRGPRSQPASVYPIPYLLRQCAHLLLSCSLYPHRFRFTHLALSPRTTVYP
jgi:hypothetical protein